LRDKTTKVPGDVRSLAEPPVGRDEYKAKESRGYSVSGVSSVSEICCPSNSETDEEVVEL
jgi:hypothetical protein